MNFELFVAQKIIAGKRGKNTISSPIIKIAVLAIALGVAIMMISIAITAGFQHKIRDKIAGFKGHVQITNYDNNNSDVSTVPIDINQDFYPEFKDVKGVKNVQIYANKGGIIRTTTDFEGIIFKGVDKGYDFSFFEEYLTQGRLPNLNQARNREIIVSELILNRLQLKVSDTIQVWFSAENSKVPFKRRKPVIVGAFKTGFDQFDSSIILGDIREVQRLNGWTENQVGGFEVLLNNFDEIQVKGNEIYSNTGATLNSTTIINQFPAIFEWIKLFDNNVWFILVIMILIAGINMITALLVLILERVQMVGILKALGAQNWSIQKVFLYNAGYLILKGLLWGNLIGLVLLFVQHYFKIIPLDPETYYVSTVPVFFNWWHLFLLNVGTMFLCLLMLLVPSKIIANIHPSKSIKFA